MKKQLHVPIFLLVTVSSAYGMFDALQRKSLARSKYERNASYQQKYTAAYQRKQNKVPTTPEVPEQKLADNHMNPKDKDLLS